MSRADEIFTSGLETVVSRSRVIVTGPAINFSKRVIQSDAPSGTPLRWEIQGEIRQAQVLKGDRPPLPIRFTRAEQAVFLDQSEVSPWEGDYLEWQTGDHALIFFMGADTALGMRVYPSGSGERDLASQVGRIVTIQSISDPARQFEAWRNALKSASASAEKQAALRSLMNFKKPWGEMVAILQQEMASADNQSHGFIFGLVAFGIMHEYWSNLNEPADFLCERLVRETNEDLTVRYLAVFGPLLNFAGEGRKSLKERLNLCLQQRCLVGSKKTAQACEDIRARYAR